MKIKRKIKKSSWDKLKRTLIEVGVHPADVQKVCDCVSINFLGYAGQEPEDYEGIKSYIGCDFTTETLTDKELEQAFKIYQKKFLQV